MWIHGRPSKPRRSAAVGSSWWSTPSLTAVDPQIQFLPLEDASAVGMIQREVRGNDATGQDDWTISYQA
jgi:hypothetical protein